MELERVRSTVLRGTFQVYELAALMAAVRYVTKSAPPEVPAESLQQLRQLLDDYDQQVRTLPATHATAPPRGGH
ncbi:MULTISPECIES: hypothetical protein [unclassified Streptomyces]|uniref:hypothetical protein n=1 Tax=unclassified Streptomyces TaxID=2593676 RepID=UPI002DD9BA7C|nr:MULTISPECIES: hypothetical protein [unclassified Streptomyces]WSA95022.1 hypothetical protein OIE63_28310 [Streptomyces sp. NBC_01795]WSB79442.1 hypothetical protein OHB04_29425 [Streptomyces sp. NBC_01775]WSS12353.1 hypothetical protein OG533_10790 [Streptomyces sp. NBC_01186]WSS41067.1 hypothetical protein OG220_10955 [Streptomyces sp. NBC_01187]